MDLKLINALEYDITAYELATEGHAAALPMLFPVLINNGFGAIITVEFRIVQSFKGKSVDFLGEVDLFPAVDTGAFVFHPFCDAHTAAKLVALLTLPRLLHDEYAYGANEVSIQSANCFLGVQFLFLNH